MYILNTYVYILHLFETLSNMKGSVVIAVRAAHKFAHKNLQKSLKKLSQYHDHGVDGIFCF